jgi:hypothetical protein
LSVNATTEGVNSEEWSLMVTAPVAFHTAATLRSPCVAIAALRSRAGAGLHQPHSTARWHAMAYLGVHWSTLEGTSRNPHTKSVQRDVRQAGTCWSYRLA